MIKIKICGLTTVQDALWAWRCGADLLGFVLVPTSRRYVSPERLGEMARILRREGCGALLVGVLAPSSPPQDCEAAQCHLDLIQWHNVEGNGSPREMFRLPVIAVQGVRSEPTWRPTPMPGAWAILLDGYDPVRLGGAGKTWDWRLLEGWVPVHQRIIVAGGLTPENVSEAIARVRPWGVDVSSGVEDAPGRKNPRRVQEFIQNAKGASYGERS